VARLRAQLDGDELGALHRGATSQDVADTVLVLQVAQALRLIEGELVRLGDGLAALAREHRLTPALGRTLLQPAGLVSLGMRAANWMLVIDAACHRVAHEGRGMMVVQLGGAVGSLAALGAAGPGVRASVAARLGLRAEPAWHSRRDAIAGLGAALGIAIGATGKLARDVSLLMQPELSELAEPTIAGRGGSSAMPGKRNPTGCQVALSAAIRAPGLVAALLGGLPQELERGLGGWQAEAPVIVDLCALAHGAMHAMRVVVEGLEINLGATTAHALAAADTTARDAALAAADRFVDDALAAHAAAAAHRPGRRGTTRRAPRRAAGRRRSRG
jgi:3-carboxy-cis,cis-muconate cycloisomerase